MASSSSTTRIRGFTLGWYLGSRPMDIRGWSLRQALQEPFVFLASRPVFPKMRQSERRGQLSATTAVDSTLPEGRDHRLWILSPRLLEVTGVAVVVTVSSGNHSFTGLSWPELGVAVLPWVVVTGLADLAPVPIWGSVQLMMSFPVPWRRPSSSLHTSPGLVSFVGTVDTRGVQSRDPAPSRALHEAMSQLA
jgi:hypothetical protein